MKKVKGLCIVLAIVMFFNFNLPVVNATQVYAEPALNVYVDNNFAIYGKQDGEMLYNILVDMESHSGQFAIRYENKKDYVYEYIFNIGDIVVDSFDVTLSEFWNEVEKYCFSNVDGWKEIYITEAVITYEDNIAVISESDDVEYFEQYLRDLYGNEYPGRFATSRQNMGMTWTAKYAFQVYASKDKTYRINEAMTVIGVVTGVLGLVASANALAVIGAIAAVGGYFTMNTSIYEYTLRANWYKYVVANEGGYPYSIGDKFIYYTGYVSSETGSRAVDTESQRVEYIPSESMYNSYNMLFEAAYEKYDEIGWVEGQGW